MLPAPWKSSRRRKEDGLESSRGIAHGREHGLIGPGAAMGDDERDAGMPHRGREGEHGAVFRLQPAGLVWLSGTLWFLPHQPVA